MAKRKRPRSPRRPRSETHYQRIHRLIEERSCGLLSVNRDYPCPCPRKSGPEHPDPNHPGMVWHRTCSGCRYFAGLYFDSHVCTHPQARRVATRWLADAIRRWEESQRETPKQQLSLF